jgi:replicative DNA helicase
VVLVKTIISLRESGAIEQDADIVSFYRQNIIKLTNGMMMKLRQQGQAEIMIAKHRNGSIETFD